MTIDIECDSSIKDKNLLAFDYEKTAEDVIRFTLSHEEFPYEAEINLFLTDDEGIRRFNRDYRQTDRATDVLSFPMIHYERAGDFTKLKEDEDNFNPDTKEAVLGDIIISVPAVIRQAESYGHRTLREYAFLIVHSMLHLFGYDHMTEQDAAVMEPKQAAILEKMQIFR